MDQVSNGTKINLALLLLSEVGGDEVVDAWIEFFDCSTSEIPGSDDGPSRPWQPAKVAGAWRPNTSLFPMTKRMTSAQAIWSQLFC